MTASLSGGAAAARARGWAVFPVGGDDRKRPLRAWREYEATGMGLADWERDSGITGYGIDCGRSGLVVLDEDEPCALDALQGPGGEPLPATFTVTTGKGRHLYYLAPVGGPAIRNSARTVAPGVDVRAEGGYVVGPGSLHASGVVYAVADSDNPVPLPAWLADRLSAPEPAEADDAALTVVHTDETTPWGRAILDDAVAQISAAAVGTRNHTLNEAAFRVSGLVKGGQIEPHEAVSVLRDAAEDAGLPRDEAQRTIASAARAAKPTPGPAAMFPDLTAAEIASADGAVGGTMAVGANRPAGDWWIDNPLLAAPLSNRPPAAPPRVLRIDGTNGALFAMGRVSRLFGFSGSGKTWAAMAAVIERVREGEPVLYLDTDSTFDDFADRLVALGMTDTEAASGQLHYARPEGSLIDPAFATFLRSRPWGLVVLDGFNNALAFSAPRGRSGLDADDVARFYRAALYPAADTGAAVVVIDHKNLSGGAHGSVHKQNDLTGTDYDVTRGAVFAPGAVGYAEIRLTHKDRAGWATSLHAKSGRAETAPFAYLIVDSSAPGVTATRVALDLPLTVRKSSRPSADARAVADAGVLLSMLVDAGVDFASTRQVRDALKERAQDMDNKRLDPAAERLVALGLVQRPNGARGALGLRLLPEALAASVDAGDVVRDGTRYSVAVDVPAPSTTAMFADERGADQ